MRALIYIFIGFMLCCLWSLIVDLLTNNPSLATIACLLGGGVIGWFLFNSCFKGRGL